MLNLYMIFEWSKSILLKFPPRDKGKGIAPSLNAVGKILQSFVCWEFFQRPVCNFALRKLFLADYSCVESFQHLFIVKAFSVRLV